mmetsp:Transcript_56245/g.114571  ORF Transcript_56245/g.114571 Transcript_56245/m.114571 type:complete len:212 (-) Transcript_56245:214-849(-)
MAGTVKFIGQLGISEHIAGSSGRHPVCPDNAQEAFQQVDDQQATQIVEPNPSNINPLDFVHDMEGITKAGQKGNQKISSHDANEEQQRWPRVSSQDVAHVQRCSAGEDVQLNGNRHLKIGHGHAILSTFLWISGGVRVNDVRQVQCHGLSRANEAIQEGSQQNLWHGGNLRQCRRGRIVTGHWQHRYIIHQGQQDHVKGGHCIVVGINQDR